MLQRKNNSQPQSNKPNEKRKRRKIGEKKTHKSFLGQIKQRTVKPSKRASAFGYIGEGSRTPKNLTFCPTKSHYNTKQRQKTQKN